MATDVSQYSWREAVRRIPTDDKLVRHRLLNVLGCQVGRVLAAEALVRVRRRRLNGGLTDIEATLIRDGVASVEDFLPANDFGLVLAEMDRAEAKFFGSPPAADKFGIVRQKVSVRKHPTLFPHTSAAMLGSERLLHMARIAEGWSDGEDFMNHSTALTYERLDQATDPVEVAPSRDGEVSSGDMHADTFHYVTKAFLTLNDVTEQNSPYSYAIGSQRITARRLVWEYRNSLRGEQYHGDEYHNRIWEAEQRRLGLDATPILVKRNTLIVTNTFGFHRRGSMTALGEVRRMLRLDFRSNPFRR